MRIRKMSLALAALGIALSVTASAALPQMDKLKNTTPEERAGAQTETKGSEGPLMKMRHMKQINTKKEADLKRVLSPGQFQKYLASKEEMREQFEEKMEKR
jgi:(p)ppGpp synthase/HD superfamily hydrolase